MVLVTKHALERGLLRCKMNKAEFCVFAQQAFWQGLSQMECQAGLGRFVDIVINRKLLRGKKTRVRVWHGFLFVFSRHMTVITVYPLSPALADEAASQLRLRNMPPYDRAKANSIF